MSRLFDGVDDVITFAPVDWAYGTLLIVAKIVTTSDLTWQSFIEGENSGGTIVYSAGRRSNGELYLGTTASLDSKVTIEDADGWALYAITKATGSVAATSHKVILSSGTRTSTAHAAAIGNPGTLGAGRIKIGGDDDPANIKVAAAAIFNGTVLTATQLDGIASAKTTQSIADLAPTWLVDDADAFTADLIGAADRTAITGTADDADDPTSWVYGLSGGTTQVSSTRRVVYSVQKQVTATRRVNYGVRANVAATRRLVYAVTAAVIATRRVSYSVTANVTGSRRVVYDVAASTTQIAATRGIVYSVSAQVAATRRVRYDVLASVLAERRVVYDVSKAVTATRRVSYAVSANVTAPRHVVYVVGEATERAPTLSLMFAG